MPVLTGRGVVYGAKGDISAIGAASLSGKTMNRSLRVDDNFDLKEILNSEGDAEALVGTNKSQTLTIDFVPASTVAGATLAGAIDTANDSLPLILSKVTLSGFAVDFVNGDWNYVGGASYAHTQDDVLVVTLPLKKFQHPDGSDNTDIVTPVT